jgi:hypothetical protein
VATLHIGIRFIMQSGSQHLWKVSRLFGYMKGVSILNHFDINVGCCIWVAWVVFWLVVNGYQ